MFSHTLSEAELKKQARAEVYLSLENGKIKANGEEMLDTEKIRVAGRHNVSNFMAAIAMSYGRCSPKRLGEVAESFTGLPHRREPVADFGGVRYYDSSIDSSPKRCSATLASFDEKVIIILGGRTKGLDFRELIPALISKAKYIIAMGECAEEIERTLFCSSDFIKAGIPFVRFKLFCDAVEHAAKKAKSGDTVLLSPAATSYDQFANFEERGLAFKRILKDIESKGFIK